MHPSPQFRSASLEQNIDFIRQRSFGVLAINGDPAPLTSSIPVLLSEDATHLDFHLVRSNPIALAATSPTPAALLLNGPDSYISPDWYGIDDQVPTWNYVAVRVDGDIETLPQDALLPLLDQLSSHFELQLSPKAPWTHAKMRDETLNKLLKMILPFRLHISKIDGTWKLGQNKDEHVRLAAAEEAAKSNIGQELTQLSELMKTISA